MKLASLAPTTLRFAVALPFALAFAAFASLATASLSARAAETQVDVPYIASSPDRPVQPTAPSTGFLFGVSAGFAAPSPAPFLDTFSIGPGPTLGVSAGYRWRYLYFGASYEHAFFTGASSGHDGAPELTTNARGEHFGLDFITLSDPDATVAFLTHVGVGLRMISADEYSDGPPALSSSQTGWDVRLLGIGLQVKADNWLRIAPEVSLSVGDTAFVAALGVTAYFELTASSGPSKPSGAKASTVTRSTAAPAREPAIPSRDLVAPYSGRPGR